MIPDSTPRIGVAGALMALFVSSFVLTGCSTGGALRADRLAHQGGLTAQILQGQPFRHFTLWRTPAGASDTLFVFIEGDGVPWSNEGREPSRDPTPRRPLGLELAAHTKGPVLYLGRPCYYTVHSDAPCAQKWWTSARYSQPVVDSMVVALDHFAAKRNLSRAVLIGYSGGGTLALLMAHRARRVTQVVTIAANIDIDAWARHHGYLALTDSVNPATLPVLPAGIREIHLVGARDRVVTPELNSRYFKRLAPDQLWFYPDFDHTCCWTQAWPEILQRIRSDVERFDMSSAAMPAH